MVETTEIQRWMKRARRLMAECPKGYWLWAANGNLHVMKCSNGSHAVESDGGMDPKYALGEIAGRGMPGPSVDGGDW